MLTAKVDTSVEKRRKTPPVAPPLVGSEEGVLSEIDSGLRSAKGSTDALKPPSKLQSRHGIALRCLDNDVSLTCNLFCRFANGDNGVYIGVAIARC